LDITDVRLRIVESNRSTKLKAFASITIDRVFVVHDLKVIEGHRGLFVAMPSRKTPSGEFKDIAHPIDQGTRDHITEVVLAEYKSSLGDEMQGSRDG
jgi:stage V sporulation protein G